MDRWDEGGWDSVKEDPYRHGRFTIIVDRGDYGLNQVQSRRLIKVTLLQLFSTRYDECPSPISSNYSGITLRKTLKNKDSGVDIIGRENAKRDAGSRRPE